MKKRIFKLHSDIKRLKKTQEKIKKYYNDILKKADEKNESVSCTLDGKLVGDIAEAVAVQQFDIILKPRKGVDAEGRRNNKNVTVQIKATGREKAGPAYIEKKSRAKHLLFFWINYEKNVAELIYDGPEAKIFERGKGNPSRQRMVELDKKVNKKDRLKRRDNPIEL